MGPPTSFAENLIKDLRDVPQAEVDAACRKSEPFAWVACRELGERAHYGRGVAQDVAAARRFREQATAGGSLTGNVDLRTLALDERCAALGAKVLESSTVGEVEDCGSATTRRSRRATSPRSSHSSGRSWPHGIRATTSKGRSWRD